MNHCDVFTCAYSVGGQDPTPALMKDAVIAVGQQIVVFSFLQWTRRFRDTYQRDLVEVIGLGNGRLLQPGALRCNAAITRSSIGLVVAAGYAGGFQSPPIVTTLAACAANASETEHSLTIPWARERRCENGPEPTALRNFLFWIWLSSSPEHLSTLAALGKMFKRSSLQPFRTAGNLIIHEPPAFRLYQE